MKSVSIVGGGIGSLCTAVRLLSKGYDVSVFEKEEKLGGKINSFEVRNARFDLTASILMTPDIYTNLFLDIGKDYTNYFELIDIDPVYKVFYSDKKDYKFYSNLNNMVRTLDDIEENLSVEYISFLSKSLKKYLYSKEYFLDKPMIELNEILDVNSIKKLLDTHPLQSSYKYLEKTIGNKKLLEYLIFQTMYIGINPYENTSLYTLIPAISHIYGLRYIKGGMYKYVEVLERLINELGGKVHKNSKVDRIMVENRKVVGVQLGSFTHKSDVVVCNADYPYAIDNLIEEGLVKYKTRNEDYSCSVFMIYIGLSKKIDDLEVHNIYVSDEFRDSIESAFKGVLISNPSIYMYYPSKVDKKISGDFESILNIMVRVPNLSFESIKWNTAQINRFRNIVINQVKKIKGLEKLEDYIEYESYLTPDDMQDKFNTKYGSSFGISHKLSKTAYFRPHIKSKDIRGLYFIGASTHPGNGVSVVIEGSKIVSNLIENDFKFTKNNV